jgi:hypothetical protein
VERHHLGASFQQNPHWQTYAISGLHTKLSFGLCLLKSKSHCVQLYRTITGGANHKILTVRFFILFFEAANT